MITFLSLSERICQFFDSIYKTNKSSFGFSSVGDESFREERINQDIRPSYDFSSTDFISSDLDLSKWKTILVGSRTIDIYIRGVLGKTILQIPAMTINELLTALNAILPVSNFYANISVGDFVLSTKINDLLLQARTGLITNITAIRRLNKMLLCSIYSTQIITSATYLIPINVSTLLFYRIEDYMLGNGIQSNSISYDLTTGEEIIDAIKNVDVVVNVISKKSLAKDAVNFFNFAVQSERKQDACYSSDFDLILFDKSNPQVLTELEKGAWLERVEQRLSFKYTDSLKLEKVDNLQTISNFDDVKEVIDYGSTLKES
jgi:hypothetical protein